MKKSLDWLMWFSYRCYARLSRYRYKGEARNYMEMAELDRLYEVEDFLRNIGESRRADDVGCSRRFLKGCVGYTWELMEENDELKDELYG